MDLPGWRLDIRLIIFQKIIHCSGNFREVGSVPSWDVASSNE